MCHETEWNVHSRRGHPDFFGEEFPYMLKDMLGYMKHHMKRFEGWVPYDIEDSESDYMISVPLPGLSREDLEVSLISSNLNIKAQRKGNKEDVKKNHFRHPEFRRGDFLKDIFTSIWKRDVNLDIPLPSNADEDSIKSKMKDGLLRIKIGKKPPKKVDINTEENE
ncbi:MAG: Hsp20/alpha crystallin family protein [Promethearchaeati archaeon]